MNRPSEACLVVMSWTQTHDHSRVPTKRLKSNFRDISMTLWGQNIGIPDIIAAMFFLPMLNFSM